ncbi:MAG: GGDEF domain-containing protein [Parcubacteria group bacterium]|nr:GGDEF domain-containing protein [Parcubacteria group bacterium]
MPDELKDLKQELRKKDLQIKELQVLATKDPLTGLLNRRGFEEKVSRLINDIIFSIDNPQKRRHFFIDSISILFFDIDNFKKLNDEYGHKTGDGVLQQISAIISQKVRGIDFVARWGGEELVVALIGSHEEDAYRKAEEIRKALKSRVKAGSGPVTVSAGVASLDGKATLEELVKRADKAMYEAKHNRGKDNIVKHSEISNF